MAEAFVELLIENLTSILQGELRLLFGFEKEFEKLSSVFSTIQAVLEDAEERQLKDKQLKDWLQKLNAATYEVDDILDEYKTKATRFLHSKYGRYHPKAISFRHNVGKRMEQVMEKLNEIAEERNKFHLREKITEIQIATRESGPTLPEGQVYGRGKEEDEIVKILINNVQELSVLPILGMGGLGKTTLAQMVINDRRVKDHFDPRIWICVSEDFNVKRLIKKIVEFIEEQPLGGNMDLAPLQKKLQDLLKGKRYLLVLDDVWNEDQHKWANLRAVLKVGTSGASVLTTTRLQKVGSIMGTLQPYELSNLSQEDCWLMFMQRAFGLQEEINPNLVPIGKEIVKKCGGVPLAASTLGGIMRFYREVREWEHVRDSEIWNLCQDETSILPALRLSYHHLPLNLRQCFVYCAVFPKDTEMEKENLISLWMAHGFLLSKSNLEPEDVGNQVWKELSLRSFFQEIEVKSGKTYFKMHDLIHELATSLFSASTSRGNIREINAGYSHRMSIGFAELVPSYTPSLLKKFVSLRVLNLSYSELEQLPASIGDLVHLRYLNLSGNDEICSLPEQLCKLQKLQTLDLLHCPSLSCLPNQTSKLVSLRYLLLDDCHKTSTPPGIGSLTCLKTLDWFVVGEGKGHQLGELRNLSLYGSIEITKLERVKKDTDAREANLCAKANLHSLSLIWDEDEVHSYESEEVKVLEALKPHPNLTSLQISGFNGIRLPGWINHSVLKNVVSIVIRSCKNCSCLPPFGELPCLESLQLLYRSAKMEYVEEEVDVHSGRFPSLRKLCIREYPNLKGLVKKEGEGQFPVLLMMEISDCPMFVFPTLSSVKKLKVADATGLTSISNLSALSYLCIGPNYKDTSLPEEMFKSLANLEYLRISEFLILKELPTSLASLNALKILEIEFCPILESLPEEGVKGLTSLTELSIKNCEWLKCLPEGLQHLTALTTLTIIQCTKLDKRCEEGTGQDWHKIAHIPNRNIFTYFC